MESKQEVSEAVFECKQVYPSKLAGPGRRLQFRKGALERGLCLKVKFIQGWGKAYLSNPDCYMVFT